MTTNEQPSNDPRTEQRPPRIILVATEGGLGGTKAVHYAAKESARLGAELRILHVVPSYLPAGPVPTIPEGAVDEHAKTTIEHAVDSATTQYPELEVSSAIAVGGRVQSIVNESKAADLVVLGRPTASLVRRLWTGATAAGVAALSTRPVIVVPDTWDEADPQHHRIVVGIKRPEHTAELMARAFELAAATDSELHVIHAWRLTGVYDDMIVGRIDESEVHEQARKVIDEVVEAQRAEHPGVTARIEVRHGQPAHELVEASRSADRVLISRPVHGGAGMVHHLGATARAVLRESHCPVEVVPPVASPA